jgi:hypothetical protein
MSRPHIFIPRGMLPAVPAGAVEATVGGVRQPVITIHVACHWFFLTMFSDASPALVTLMAGTLSGLEGMTRQC